MPLIDGKYEILRQAQVDGGRTLVHATDPDGAPVRIVWYDLDPADEPAFERYRRALRRLGRDEDVALREVVSRPGARYAVWEDAADAPAARPDPAWRRRLEAAGLDPNAADLRRRDGTVLLAGVGFGGDAALAADAPTAGASGSATPDPADTATGGTGAGRRAGLPTLSTQARTWLVGLLLATAAVAAALTGWTRYDNDATVIVPDLAGRTANEAAERLHALRLAVEARALADGAAPGTVVATEPPAGTTLRPGRTVRLDYVLPRDGAATRVVPPLEGRPLEDAMPRLREGELRVGDVAYVPARLPAGTVLGQRPASGERASPGAPVDLIVSDGPTPERSFLPDVAGLDVETAREIVRLAGVPADRILVDRVAAPGVPEGRVVETTPAPWHPVRTDGVTVRLLVAAQGGTNEGGGGAGTGAGGVPDVTGLSFADARARLDGAGFGVEVDRTSTRALPAGVVGQTPPPGGGGADAVRLLVNAPPVAVPRPEPTAEVRAPRLRWVPYRFLIEPGIPTQTAELLARTADGGEAVVLERDVVGGDVIEGTWPTLAAGAVTFELRLNDVPYAESRVTRDVDGP